MWNVFWKYVLHICVQQYEERNAWSKNKHILSVKTLRCEALNHHSSGSALHSSTSLLEILSESTDQSITKCRGRCIVNNGFSRNSLCKIFTAKITKQMHFMLKSSSGTLKTLQLRHVLTKNPSYLDLESRQILKYYFIVKYLLSTLHNFCRVGQCVTQYIKDKRPLEANRGKILIDLYTSLVQRSLPVKL